ncbi:diguanylate cyclase (GGDEF) domain-containing protein [Devosia lucknowensis]|uniref:Diguanylate cyclase (GGDEF) domain-containing protein n=1 Tax=Devosia lucknowensis TaxID=1096929 RepID=A0A1Y6ET67_9HYPH|nr:diguanylate cyclase [Devosia lucknowensis]SMQ65419.1 diguanylate cyclase (GGDEF) domain-containing protein [Devosia lucknowensis]
MSGAAILGQGCRLIAHDGASLPAVSEDILGPTGQVIPLFAHGGVLVVAPIPGMRNNMPVWLALWDGAPRDAAYGATVLARVTELAFHATTERRQAADKARLRLMNLASATAQIGIWSCRLPDETLTWTDGVYDIFELPRGSRITRETTLGLYVPESARQMQALRAEAIATLGSFNFDAEIVTARGNRRWMRITATVETVNGRARSILGMKQDITDAKQQAERIRRQAETDTLTGLANRAVFQARLDTLHGDRPVGSLILVDLDRFKAINDELGHAQGDACLQESGRRLMAACPPGTLVSRIGGDEFAVLTDQHSTVDDGVLCDRIVQAFEAPFVLGGNTRHVGASVGFARRDDHGADCLYRNADLALYQAKSAGRGTWRQFIAA